MTQVRTFADQVAAADPIAAATRIAKLGARAAISASTVEIVAMALLLNQLKAITDTTYDLFKTADHLDGAVCEDVLRDVSAKISIVGASLEALGYGDDVPQQQEEK
ncbi:MULTISPECIES: hypothetical protein [unclassified Bradyrhizobium]|uniref:hypothetical protein n=1 Tax=unclassified Bradyrhizobium TaxID=2631580 RepID=UPI002916BB25|nr:MULTISPECIES: hypothetical protein [unclassified Bradyrhizobium]